MVAKASNVNQINFDPSVWVDKHTCPKIPTFFKLQERKFVIDGLVQQCIITGSITDEAKLISSLKIAKSALQKVRLNAFQVVVLKIANVVIRIFKKKYSKINEILSSNANANKLIHTYTKILNAGKKGKTDKIGSDNPTSGSTNSGGTTVTDLFNQNRDQLGSIQRNLEANNRAPYDVSFETLEKEVSNKTVADPIRLTVVAAEYVGIIKTGGLAEAVEGITQSIVKDNSNNKVRLVFPKYNIIDKDVRDKLTANPETYITESGEEYKVYACDLNGVECLFIDHPAFKIEGKKVDIYSSEYQSSHNYHSPHNRFAIFSELAADFIYKTKDQDESKDILHLHDWHVAGIALLLKKNHEEEWAQGKTPTTIFTYHNSSRGCQGRLTEGLYTYDSVIQGYKDRGIIKNNENLFIETLMVSDGVTTVSENYAKETQNIATGEGVSFAVRMAAKAGKLVGIINGIDTNAWNPANKKDLINWKDVETGETIDLSYSPKHEDIQGQKDKSRIQLQKWIDKHWDEPKPKIDLSKPLVGFIGRFDSSQKGIDKFEEAIESTLKNGGQFICMGSGEDKKSTKILDKLEDKYKNQGVFFIRDFKDKETNVWKHQIGTPQRPGIGSLVRSCLDFTFIPSKFEPCGLVQFEAWMFGSLAIGSETGGLKDTIIPLEKDQENYNGFTFMREGDKKLSAGATIEKALKFWAEKSKDEKSAVSKRVMEQSLQYGWNSSPLGKASPAKKYRFTYERAKEYKIETRNSFRKIQSVRGRVFEKTDQSHAKELAQEEDYLCKYYYGDYDSEYLSKLYLKLPKKTREGIPSPYGKKVDSANYEKYGSFTTSTGTKFNVLAPNAKVVEVAIYNASGEFQGKHLMEKDSTGNWKAEIPNVKEGELYQYIIDGRLKFDPYSRQNKFSTKKGHHQEFYSVVSSSKHVWNDKKWMAERVKKISEDAPMSIYEVHPLLWKKESDKPLNYRQLGEELVKHCKQVGYTHVELMGILEHLNDAAFGCYHVSGYFAPTSRMGSVDDFKAMVNYLHENNIAIILDWVPAHFSNDKAGLANFDGSKMYEPSGLPYETSIRKIGFKYGAVHFDYKKRAVRDFLISSAEFWVKEMHIDGLRVDCVRSLLNTEDKKSANLFMRDLNAVVHNQNAITMAEDYSGDTKVTGTAFREGLGFDMKWHVSWMKSTLDYFRTPLTKRSSKFNTIKNAINGDLFHKQVVVFSHDEMKEHFGALINQTPGLKGDQKYANARAMMSFLMCSPGKKLYFMGSEFGSDKVWTDLDGKKNKEMKDKAMMDQEAESKDAKELMSLMKAFNSLYTGERAFYEYDANGRDVDWIVDPKKQVHAYRREGKDGSSYACFHNFGASDSREFTVSLLQESDLNYQIVEAINTDDQKFGGKGATNGNINQEIVEEEMSLNDVEEYYSKFNRQIRMDEKLEDEIKKLKASSKLDPKDIKIKLKTVKYKITIPPLSTVVISEKGVNKVSTKDGA